MANNFAPVAFESTWKKNEEKQQLRQAREAYLETAKEEFKRKEWKKEQARLRGEGTWMLSSVTDRIDEENKEIEEAVYKKDKKKKKQKKEKKHKKEKEDSKNEEKNFNVPKPRDDWMMAPVDLFSGVTREQLRAEKNAEKEKEAKEKALLDRPGMHARELNPYWKDGGTGLPEKQNVSKSGPVIGDGGVAWLRKAYQRCKEQAKEEGRSFEDLAAERYGSLAKLEEMIKEAEKKQPAFRRPRSRSPERRERRSRSRDRRSTSRDKSRSGSGERKRKRSRSRDRTRNRSRSRERRRSKSGSRDRRSRSRSDDRRRSRSRSRERKRSRSHSREKKSRSRSRDRYRSRRSRSSSKEKTSAKKGLKGMFMKPGELERGATSSRSSSSSGGWRKEGRRAESSSAPAWKKEVKKKSPTPRPSSSDSSPSSESEHEEEKETKSETEHRRSESPPPVILLSEDEMNKLAAKIMRAQILGNDAQSKELQAKLDAAREARKNAPAEALAGPSGNKSREMEEVVLTRTDRGGMTRPVYESQQPKEPKRGRRKPQKVLTHDDGGERTRYFDDDDKYSLKDLVKREKMSTAEDQNSMFSRLSGKSFEKTTEDHDLDDVFMTRAARKQSDSKQEERDRSAAIFEHKKVNSALDKCNRCMEKTSKHLIIAIGIKVYLCVPAHKSLATGHCFIVPIQHVSAGTSVDEDVWTEIQVFRKGLTRMFKDQDEDVVFMETAMNLKYHPHMAIEVIPISNELGHMAPIYFKKAIQEAGEEWAQNKKLVDLSGRDVRKALPKGFPYFSVDFGLQSGYAHVIEDEKTFPNWFGREIVGGMLEEDAPMWRKPHKESFDDQRKKVLEFAAMWKPYDWTHRLKKPDSDSDSDN